MTGELIIKLSPLPYPYQNETKYIEDWGEISISFLKDGKSTQVFYWQWNIIPFIEWFVINLLEFSNPPLFEVLPGENLSQAEEKLRCNEINDDNQDLHDKLFKFRSSHDISFGLKGTPISSIIIGLNNHKGEISSLEENNEFEYFFDMQEFIKWTLLESFAYLIQCPLNSTKVNPLNSKINQLQLEIQSILTNTI
jgi:hypothetical protein